MNQKIIGGIAVGACSFALVATLLLKDDDLPKISAQPEISAAINQEESETVVAFSQTPKIKAAVMTEDEIFIAEGVRQQMADIAAAYEENIRYPTYSPPLHENNWDLLNPNAFISKPRPLDFDESISAEIVLDRYIVSNSQDLDVQVKLHGSVGYAPSHKIKLGIVDGSNFSLLGEASYVGSDAGAEQYQAMIPSERIRDLPSGEVQLAADIEFDQGEQARVVSVFKLVGNDATLISLGDSYVDGANLIIPAEFKVEKPGFYRIQANLFDAEGELPISHLNVAFMLGEFENTGLLKVHASTLRHKGHAGPYLLTDFNITRGPARPGDQTGYGTTESVAYEVQGFDLDSYSREAYEDPKAKQRLEFLQKLAGTN